MMFLKFHSFSVSLVDVLEDVTFFHYISQGRTTAGKINLSKSYWMGPDSAMASLCPNLSCLPSYVQESAVQGLSLGRGAHIQDLVQSVSLPGA